MDPLCNNGYDSFVFHVMMTGNIPFVIIYF